MAERSGAVTFMSDSEAAKKELNQKTRRSTKFAVLVMRDEQKVEARRFFDTPLLFSIQEAKGLEYENVILWNFILLATLQQLMAPEGADARAGG